METGVLLPIRLEGIPPAGGAPEATGVDEVSVGSTNPDFSLNSPDAKPVQDRLWIMVPAGGGSTTVTLKAPLNENTPLKLSAPGITFNGQAEISLTSTTTTLEVKASDPTKTGEDITATLKFGPSESVSHPVGIKIMKRRTVKVTVHPIGSITHPLKQNEQGKLVPDLTAPKQAVSPVNLPTKAELEARIWKKPIYPS